MMIAAIDRAVEHCIETGILKDFLVLHKTEVKNVILTEYDKKRHERTLIEQGVEIGESVRNLVSLEVHASLDKSSICRNLLSILGIFCCRIFLLLLV